MTHLTTALRFVGWARLLVRSFAPTAHGHECPSYKVVFGRGLMALAGLCLILVFASTVVRSDERVVAPAQPIPSCGIASTLSWLMATGHTATLQDVEAQFASQSPDFVPSAVSIAEVKQCLSVARGC